jgi:hypothetical protein
VAARSSSRARAILVALLVLAGVLATAPGALACSSSGYTYAGLASPQKTYGVGAVITAIGSPLVSGTNGHVAGWVGVGGPKLGPNGTDEWIQVGFSGFSGRSTSDLYFEVNRSGVGPAYHEVEANLPAGTKRRVAVLEVAAQPNWWQVWVDGRAVSKPIYLPGSHGSWPGIATAESWSEDASAACNGYGYRFDDIQIAQAAGGAWQTLSNALPIRTGENQLLRSGSSSASFEATSGPVVTTGAARKQAKPGTEMVAGTRSTASARR